MEVLFNSLVVQDQNLRNEYHEAINKVYDHGIFIHGPEVNELEKTLGTTVARKYCIGVASGTFSIAVALKALAEKDKKRRKVILPALGWIATPNAIIDAGLEPIFCDINNDFSLNIESVKKHLSNEVLAIIPVHFTGKINTNIVELQQLCRENKVYLVEDMAQAYGASINSTGGAKKVSGQFGDIACLSINPMKLLASHGEAGAVFTNDLEVKEFVNEYRYQGMKDPGSFSMAGFNGRIDTIM